ELKLLKAPVSLPSDSYHSFFIEIENPGVLPLRGLRIQTQPDWGSEYLAYLPESYRQPLFFLLKPNYQ
ncbi:hypothetical protein ACQVGJ_004104, partial [Escherichia coli]